MRIGIIGPSKMQYVEEINSEAKKIIVQLSKVVAESGNEIVVVPDKGSASEFFAQEYLKHRGKKVYEMVPLDDKEFGLSWMNLEIGEHINCGTWRNQPEKLNEECDILLCLGFGAGVLIEIAYSKWFKPKQVYIIKKLISRKLPDELEKSLKLNYVTIKEFKDVLRNQLYE